MAEINGKIVFLANTTTEGIEPWATDGSDAGTFLLKDIMIGTGSSTPVIADFFKFIRLNNSLVFRSNSANSGYELWVTDGTVAGTQISYDVLAGPVGGIGIYQKVNSNVFAGCSNGSAAGICVYDGQAGVAPLLLSTGGTASGEAAGDGKLFFKSFNAGNYTYWVSDGTQLGTYDIGIPASNGEFFYYYDGYAYFITTSGANSFINRTDGTLGGTSIVADSLYVPYVGSVQTLQRRAIGYKGKLIVLGDRNNDWNFEPYVIDGSSTIGVMLEINPDNSTPSPQNQDKRSSYPAWFCEYRDRVYFAAQSSETDREVWVTDGTTAGTDRLLDVFPGTAGSDPAEVQAIGTGLFFVATDSAHGRELWASDGTAAGTRCIDLRPGPESSNIRNIFSTGTELYFFAELDTALGMELYRMPIPVVDTTVSVADIGLSAPVRVWPNPATHALTVQVSQAGGNGLAGAKLYDLQGRRVAEVSGDRNTFELTLDVSSLAPGIYVAETLLADGTAHRHKVVVGGR